MPFRRLLRRPGLATFLRGCTRYLFGRRGQRRVAGLRLYYRMRMMVTSRVDDPVARLTRVREVRVWVDGEDSFARVEQLLRRARHSIIIQMFIWKDDSTGRLIAKRLLEAADRGVKVDITKEAAGDVFEFEADFLGTKQSQNPLWKRFWSHPHIHISWSANRDHAKVYVIDDQILLLTGMNIADEYRHQWHDYMVELKGQTFVRQYLTRQEEDRSGSIRLVMNHEESRRIRPAVMDLFAGAEESVIIEHCYLSDPDVVSAIVALTYRGVRVTVIIPDRPDLHHHANMAAVGQLLAEGDRAFLHVLFYPGMFHGKIILVDHARAFLGSANLMRSSLDDMGEVNVLIEGKSRAVWTLEETLRADVLASRPISGPPAFVWLSKWLAWLGL